MVYGVSGGQQLGSKRAARRVPLRFADVVDDMYNCLFSFGGEVGLLVPGGSDKERSSETMAAVCLLLERCIRDDP